MLYYATQIVRYNQSQASGMQKKDDATNILSARDNDPVVYFVLLLLLQALIFTFAYIGKASNAGFMIFRAIALCLAFFMKSPGLAGMYAIAALLNALLAFDPVGLWISQHGTRTNQQNGLCVVSFLLAIISTYLGNKFRVSIEKNQLKQFEGNEGYNNPNEAKQNRFSQFVGQAYSLQ